MNLVRTYLLATGVGLAALAAFGFWTISAGNPTVLGLYLVFDNTHNVLHVVLAAIALLAGLAPLRERHARYVALGLGVLYLALGLVGVLHAKLYGWPGRLGYPMQVEMVENMLHFALGGWGAYVGTHEPEPAP